LLSQRFGAVAGYPQQRIEVVEGQAKVKKMRLVFSERSSPDTSSVLSKTIAVRWTSSTKRSSLLTRASLKSFTGRRK
jgi:hypothetical protein